MNSFRIETLSFCLCVALAFLLFNISGLFPKYELIQRIFLILFIPLIILNCRFSSAVIIATFFLCVLFNIVWVLTVSEEVNYLSSFLYIVPCLVSFLAARILYKYSINNNLKVIGKFIPFVVIFMYVEAFVRFFYPEFVLTVGQQDAFVHFVDKVDTGSFNYFIYLFKFSSISFLDSNYVGIFCIQVLLLNEFCNSSKLKNLLTILLFILVVLSLSRAAIITVVLILGILKFKELHHFFKFIFLICCVFLLYIFLGTVFEYIESDSSFISKISSFESLAYFLHVDLVNQIFGYGFPFGGYIYSFEPGAYSHVFLNLVLGQVGLIGFALYLFLMVTAFYLGRNIHCFLICISSLILGLSLINPWSPTFFFILGVCSINIRKKDL